MEEQAEELFPNLAHIELLYPGKFILVAIVDHVKHSIGDDLFVEFVSVV
jgi:hypothetical protein